jgi:hypothetical protein
MLTENGLGEAPLFVVHETAAYDAMLPPDVPHSAKLKVPPGCCEPEGRLYGMPYGAPPPGTAATS